MPDGLGDIARLDALVAEIEYLAITIPAMRQASAFWVEARQRGRPMAQGKIAKSVLKSASFVI